MSELIGNYNKRIEIWKLSGAVNAANKPIQDWAFFKRKWSWVKGKSGLQTVTNMMNQQDITSPLSGKSFRIRYDLDILPGMQLRRKGSTVGMLIQQVLHDELDNEWTDLVVTAGGANG